MNIIFLLMMTSLLISQSFMDLMSFVIIIIGLWCYQKNLRLNHRKFEFFKIGLEKLWIVWISIWILGLFLAPVSSAEMEKNPNVFLNRLNAALELKWIINFYFFIWFFFWLKPWQSRLSKSWSWIWGLLLVFSLYGLIGLIFDFDLIKQRPLSDPGRVGGLFDDPMTFAHVYSLFFILGFFINLQKHKLLISLSTLFCGLAVFLSMTRGVWIGLFLSLGIFLYIYRKKLALIFLGATSTVFLLLFGLWPRFQERVLFAFNYSNNYDSERLWLWQANWKIFTNNPLFGIGFGQYKYRLREYYDLLGAPVKQFESHAHNQYLHFLAGTGSLGLMCFLFFIGFNLYWSWRLVQMTKNTNLSGYSFGLLAAQVSFLIAGFTESNFERAKVRWTYLVFSALALATIRSLQADPNSNDLADT